MSTFGKALTLAALGLMTLTSAQMTLEPIRKIQLKQNKKGAPNMLEQVEFVQSAVTYL